MNAMHEIYERRPGFAGEGPPPASASNTRRNDAEVSPRARLGEQRCSPPAPLRPPGSLCRPLGTPLTCQVRSAGGSCMHACRAPRCHCIALHSMQRLHACIALHARQGVSPRSDASPPARMQHCKNKKPPTQPYLGGSLRLRRSASAGIPGLHPAARSPGGAGRLRGVCAEEPLPARPPPLRSFHGREKSASNKTPGPPGHAGKRSSRTPRGRGAQGRGDYGSRQPPRRGRRGRGRVQGWRDGWASE